jgi:hypothetical protein
MEFVKPLVPKVLSNCNDPFNSENNKDVDDEQLISKDNLIEEEKHAKYNVLSRQKKFEYIKIKRHNVLVVFASKYCKKSNHRTLVLEKSNLWNKDTDY